MAEPHLWDDVFGTQMEKKRDKYSDAIDDIRNPLTQLHQDLSDATAQIQTKCNTFEPFNDTSGGLIVTDFNEAVGRWKAQMDALIRTLSQAAGALEGAMATMQTRLTELNSLCAEEKRDKKELPLSTLSF
jgi:prefoldin subunit 5